MRVKSFEDAVEVLAGGRDKQTRKIDNNTRLIRRNADEIVVELHTTNIILYRSDGSIELNSGHWMTTTTKSRMNEYSPIRVSQCKGQWTCHIDGKTANFQDGIVWKDGEFLNDGPEDQPKENSKLLRRIKKFSKSYISALDAGTVGAPDGGDCWMCLMKELGNGDVSHLLSHIDENYYVPSLLVRAVERFPVSMAAKWYLSDKWNKTGNLENCQQGAGGIGEIGRQQLEKSLYRYMKEKMGIAA